MFDYQAYYCEENVWKLCQQDAISGLKKAVLITNRERCCPIWNMKASPKGQPVFWDYHVILMAKPQEQWLVWDLDSTLATPLPAPEYLTQSFQKNLPKAQQPAFRMINASLYGTTFSSNRSHMKDRYGNWLAPPPSWPCILNGPPTFLQWLDLDQTQQGEWLDLNDFTQKVTLKPTSFDGGPTQ